MTSNKKDPVLVVLQLSGGNDYMNTVVPFGNPHYYDNRPLLGLAEDDGLMGGPGMGAAVVGRARITLNRPEKRNALSFQLQSELHEALWEADNDTEVHGVILRGAGKSFCAGYDLAPAPGTGPPRGEPDRKYRGFRGRNFSCHQCPPVKI